MLSPEWPPFLLISATGLAGLVACAALRRVRSPHYRFWVAVSCMATSLTAIILISFFFDHLPKRRNWTSLSTLLWLTSMLFLGGQLSKTARPNGRPIRAWGKHLAQIFFDTVRLILSLLTASHASAGRTDPGPTRAQLSSKADQEAESDHRSPSSERETRSASPRQRPPRS